jgi:hypothetical protein
MEIGILEEVEIAGGAHKKVPTEQGRALGLSLERRVSQNGREYEVVVYNRAAQQFVVDNLPELLEQE